MQALFAIAVLLALVWLWLDSMRAKELASAIARSACERGGLQLLDDTVALMSMGFGRNGFGHLRLRRRYRFEYTVSGNLRQRGQLTLLGIELEWLYLTPQLVQTE